MYVTLLNVDDQEYLNLKIQTLKNLELFLMAEESKMVKNNDECKLFYLLSNDNQKCCISVHVFEVYYVH